MAAQHVMGVDAADNKGAAVEVSDDRLALGQIGAVDAHADLAARSGDHSVFNVRNIGARGLGREVLVDRAQCFGRVGVHRWRSGHAVNQALDLGM